ncbi:DUF883 domain-containing protein [Pantoea sp. Aalb]|uniref:DUF883 domain-containing protein n=1 Tax=Pantoea sp. Aalb TaxID=2576762 RepID=UPI00132565A5|nr:DUF883 domain-containing protein [Pantoea sp. Aalb]MXP67315.1 DUF883 domain-containing protein [Pantoea sp. Aalb]
MSSTHKFETCDETCIDEELTLLIEPLEKLLQYSGDQNNQEYIELKNTAKQTLEDIKNRLTQTSDNYYCKAKQAAYCADDYVHEKPWQSIILGAVAGLFTGLLLARN